MARTSVLVDNLGPTAFVMSAVNPNPSGHVGAPSQATLTWGALADGSGSIKVYAATDQSATTVPPTTGTALPGNQYTANFATAGTWYVHLAAVDALTHRLLVATRRALVHASCARRKSANRAGIQSSSSLRSSMCTSFSPCPAVR